MRTFGLGRVSDILVFLCVTLQVATASVIPAGNGAFSGPSRLALTRYGNDGLDETSQEAASEAVSRRMFLQRLFSQRVRDASEMCPPQIVRLFLLTKNIEIFRLCLREQNTSTTTGVSPGDSDSTDQSDEEFTPYSAHVLKRILQNMDDGTAKVDTPYASADSKRKRSRLSIHSALTSLADMVRHESSDKSRKPLYGFHSKLLKMG